MPSQSLSSHNLAEVVLFEPATRHNDAVALLTFGKSYTYEEVCDYARRCAELLRANGCEAGDRVVIAMPDSIAFVGLFFGILAIGGIAVPVAIATTKSDFDYIVQKTRCKLAICSDSSVIRPACAVLRLNPVAPESALPQTSNSVIPCVKKTADDIAYILFSSGSTGQPKGIPHCHRSFPECAEAFSHIVSYASGDIVLSAPKLSFGYALGCSLIFPLLAGATTILLEELPDDAVLASAAERFSPTVLIGQPRNLVGLINAAGTGPFDHLRVAVVAGEKLSPTLAERWSISFPNTPLLDCYGMTEASGIFIANRPASHRLGSVGQVLAGYNTKIISIDTDIVNGTAGELWMTGPSLCKGYWEDAIGDADRFSDGWVRTGDLFYRDDDGYHFMIGRIDHLLKVGCGAWVEPTALEAVLHRNPVIAECAVVGFPDADGVIQLKACVATTAHNRPNRALRDALILAVETAFPAQSSHRLAAIEFVSDFPRTSTGKIDRRQLTSYSQTDFSYQC